MVVFGCRLNFPLALVGLLVAMVCTVHNDCHVTAASKAAHLKSKTVHLNKARSVHVKKVGSVQVKKANSATTRSSEVRDASTHEAFNLDTNKVNNGHVLKIKVCISAY